MKRPKLIANGRIFLGLALLCAGAVRAAEAPDAPEILRQVRWSQSNQQRDLNGILRTGGKVMPFRLVMNGEEIRYVFQDPPQTITLRLGETGSRIEESAAKYNDAVRGTDITYEELSLRFLYWPKARVDGEETIMTRRCWKLRLEPGGRASQYAVVLIWVEQESGALLRADAFDRDMKLMKRFEVRDVQKSPDGNGYMLKRMRIETMDPGKRKDSTPTYLEIKKE